MKTYEEILELIEANKKEANELESLLAKCEDGYIYIAVIQCYGSVSIQTATNIKCIQDIDGEWYGDNGLCTIYSTNPNANNHIENYSNKGVFFIEQEFADEIKAEIASGCPSYEIADKLSTRDKDEYEHPYDADADRYI